MSAYSETISSLFAEWRTKPEIDTNGKHITRDFFIEDGIIDESAWMKVPQEKHILFVLKDANDEHPRSDWKIRDLLDHDVKYTMWRRAAEWVRGIILTELDGPDIFYEEFQEGIGTLDWLKQTAVINLKKTPGAGSANVAEIPEYAKVDAIEIQEEIALIDPDIIICGGTRDAFNIACEISDCPVLRADTLHGYSLIKVCGRPRLVIDYYHPANRYPRILNYYGIVGIYRHALANGVFKQ
ncbi:MAG: hypothetical protein VB104_05155 [Candidatus Limiplasma sp.]|nr:hypothetical protein [Candidatus Limiplasma sp.]